MLSLLARHKTPLSGWIAKLVARRVAVKLGRLKRGLEVRRKCMILYPDAFRDLPQIDP